MSDQRPKPISAPELFRRIRRIHDEEGLSLDKRYELLYDLLLNICLSLTRDTQIVFPNLFSRLWFICKEKEMRPSDSFAIQTLRRHCDDCSGLKDKDFAYDLRALSIFVAVTSDTPVPDYLTEVIAKSNRPMKGVPLRDRIPYIRVTVESWDENEIQAFTADGQEITVRYRDGGYEGDLAYVERLLERGMQMNLLDDTMDESGKIIPGLIVTHPDYLIDVSSLAACFREYGHHPLNYMVSRLKPRANSSAILLGNFASMLLDDCMNSSDQVPVYPTEIKKFFSRNALEFCTCDDLDSSTFHKNAMSQMQNISEMMSKQFASVKEFDRDKALLEASFISEKLGLQGRADLLQNDFKLLIEQKSGKMDEFRHSHKEEHYVQMMLYHGVLIYEFGMQRNDTSTFLLYSKYPEGLMEEHFYEKLFREAISLRNRIVSTEMLLARKEGAERIIKALSPERLNEKGGSSKLWVMYQKPQLQELFAPLYRDDSLDTLYFKRFLTFIAKEQILAKSGSSAMGSAGFADTWNMPLSEKREMGNIFTDLHITDISRRYDDGGFDIVTLSIPKQEDEFLPNFRPGDMVILYAYESYPDVRGHILMKGSIKSLTPSEITIMLRNGQHSAHLIGTKEERFAIEHDATDATTAFLIRNLYSFLICEGRRKRLLLGLQQPEADTSRHLNGTYGKEGFFDELVRKVKQAKDYFLLIGPPGTGKTSQALQHIVAEELTEPNASVLLLAYTNRATDEICAMLVDSGIAARTPFIRLGHELSTDPRFVPYLLRHHLDECGNMNDIKQQIRKMRIFVATTTTIGNQLPLFNLKHFTLAIFDEASQLLEPNIVGILSAMNEGRPVIDRFVLTGDYKQLPAVVQQTQEESEVEEPEQRAIGLTNCRNSLFERLYKIRKDDRFTAILHHQGRMHPDVAAFPSEKFYAKEQLVTVPLKHQLEEKLYTGNIPLTQPLDHLVAEKRMLFFDAPATDELNHSDKCNPQEARIVTKVLESIYRLRQDEFDADRTVGVIVPYRNQIAMIRHEIEKLHIPTLQRITIDTVERYQGSQRDIIIYSFTIRASYQLDFLTANTFMEEGRLIDRKLNVVLTRARKQMILVGSAQLLRQNILFRQLIAYVEEKGGFMDQIPE